MESPHLYDNNAEYKKSIGNLKVKNTNLFSQMGDYSDLHELENSEISLDLHSLIDVTQQQQNHFVNEHQLIQDLQGLNVDKNSLGNGQNMGGHCPRGIGANNGLGMLHPSLGDNSGNIYNTLAYCPQPVHGGSQFDRQYERIPIKEEPREPNRDTPNEYPPCARSGSYGGYGGGGLSPYPMTPTTVPGVDSMLKSPMKSPPGLLKQPGQKKSDKNTDEYRRRRERNNIAVRKSREKAKARSRETEERVKILSDENKKLQERCKHLVEKVAMYHSLFNSMNVQCLPEPFRSEFRSQIEAVANQHQHHQQLLGI